MKRSNAHQPVMLTEVIEYLKPQAGAWYIDGTFGSGGHTAELLERGAKVLAFDYDQAAIDRAQEPFAEELAAGSLMLVRENFDQLANVTRQLQAAGSINTIAGMLFDFGTSTEQLTSADRGLSFFGTNEPLDMRLDNRLGVTAADIVGALPEKELARLFSEWGGESEAHSIARAIIKTREKTAIKTIGQLVEIIERSKRNRGGKLHPATKVFQALRIAVNDEMNNLSRVLPQALQVAQAQTQPVRMVTIAFHEGEDRPVKQAFLRWEAAGYGQIMTKKPLVATEEELAINPRARSAKLRVFEVQNKKTV